MIGENKWELAALWSLAMATIGGAIYIASLVDRSQSQADHSQIHGLVIGGLMSAFPVIINAIRGVGQSKAMQMMAEQLGASTPLQAAPRPADPDVLDLSAAQQI